MKIYILGTGALGSVFGSILHLANQDVTLLCHSETQANLINKEGLLVRMGDETQTILIKAASSVPNPKEEMALPKADLIIVLVKSQHTGEAIQSVLHLIDENTTIVSLQNGMGHEDTIAEFVPKRQILGGKTYVGGVRLTANSIITGHKNKLTILGEFNGENSERVNEISTIFNAAGLTTKITTNILGTMWDKLFINVATGALSGISGLCYGDLYQVKKLENTAINAVNEAIIIAKAQNINISIHEGETAWRMASDGLPYDFKASMLQSLQAGKRTEIDFINGYVVKKGIEMRIETPVNQTLVACMKGIEWLNCLVI